MRSLEMFCGTGGLALGLHQAGFEPTALLEWDKDSCENIKANIKNGFSNIKDWNVIQTDVRDIQYSELGSDIQFVSGGPPCQPFSLGGKHKAHSDTRDMFPEAVRAVRELRPQGFIFENVKGLLRNSFSSYFRYILLQLAHPEVVAKKDMDWADHLKQLEEYHAFGAHEGLEYNVLFRLVNAADYGVPQMRYRVMIVGFRGNLGAKWSFPEPTHSKDALLYSQYGDGSYWEEHCIAKKNRPDIPVSMKYSGKIFEPSLIGNRWQTVRDALKDLPDPKNYESEGFSNHEYKAGARSYTGHSGSKLDDPSKTIKAGVHGVPGGENTLTLDDGSFRYYTVRESARIQTFPDIYHFHGSWTECMRQIGNAVPVELACVIGQSVITHLGRIQETNVKRQTGYKAF